MRRNRGQRRWAEHRVFAPEDAAALGEGPESETQGARQGACANRRRPGGKAPHTYYVLEMCHPPRTFGTMHMGMRNYTIGEMWLPSGRGFARARGSTCAATMGWDASAACRVRSGDQEQAHPGPGPTRTLRDSRRTYGVWVFVRPGDEKISLGAGILPVGTQWFSCGLLGSAGSLHETPQKQGDLFVRKCGTVCGERVGGNGAVCWRA